MLARSVGSVKSSRGFLCLALPRCLFRAAEIYYAPSDRAWKQELQLRAKLLRPVAATPDSPMPGVVYIHGYQNNRETSDAYCIELARRGFVVLNIDAIGRGNSGIPNDPDDPDFDVTYGGLTSLAYLKSLPFVDAGSVGMMGHSLGAEMAYHVALVAWMFTSSQVIAPIPV